jgi:hypothetical protein
MIPCSCKTFLAWYSFFSIPLQLRVRAFGTVPALRGLQPRLDATRPVGPFLCPRCQQMAIQDHHPLAGTPQQGAAPTPDPSSSLRLREHPLRVPNPVVDHAIREAICLIKFQQSDDSPYLVALLPSCKAKICMPRRSGIRTKIRWLAVR